MNAADRAKFFKLLQEDIKETEMQTNLIPPHDDLGETLRVLMPVTDEGDPCLLEIMVSNFVEEADMVIFYTTLIGKIGAGYEDLLRALPKWNLDCPLGAFSIFETPEMKQLYHKYTILFDPDTDPADLEDNVMFHLMLLYEVVSRYFVEARELSQGKG